MELDQDLDSDMEMEVDQEFVDEPLLLPKIRRYVLFEPRPWESEVPEIKKAKVWSYRPDFSNVSMCGLRERLFGEEERNTKKLVYLCLGRSGPGDETSWMAFNAFVGPNGKEVSVCGVDDAMKNPSSGFPSELRDLTCYGCAVRDSSKIIIAGGKCKEVPSNKVFIYDTVTKTWEPSLPPMNLTRGETPTVVAIESNIYVFGGGPDITTQSEFTYSSVSWGYVPPCSTDLISPGSKIISHAVYPKGNRILFCQDPFAVSSFNYRSGRWERYDMSGSVGVGLQWNATVVVFEDILFWHHHGTIFAHDLLNHVTIPTYTLPHTGLSSALFSDDVPPSFLVHIGKGKLCLFYRVKNRIRFITYTVQISQGAGAAIPHTVLSHSGFLETTPVGDIMHALEASY